MLELKKVNFPNWQGILPATYDDTLSILEKLQFLLKKLNDIIDVVNKLDYELMRQYIDDEIVKIKNTINGVKSELQLYSDNKANQTLALAIKYIDQQINTTIILLKDYAVSQDILLKNQLQSQISNLQAQINNIEKNGFPVLDPTTGQMNFVQDVINNIFSLFRDNAITANVFDGLSLTATYLDNIQYTAFDFDMNAKEILI